MDETAVRDGQAEPGFWADAEVISVYTRAQAIEDGELVDVSTTAREAGFCYPVAMTRAAWASAVEVSDTLKAIGQDEQGRLWDVLSVLHHAIGGARAGQRELNFYVIAMKEVANAKLPRHRRVPLKSICGPGDEGEAVLTIMEPSES